MKWIVTVQATVTRTYEVEAADIKAACAATVGIEPIAEEEIDAETMSAVPMANEPEDPDYTVARMGQD